MEKRKKENPSTALLASELFEEREEKFYFPDMIEYDDEEYCLAGSMEQLAEEFCLSGSTEQHAEEFCLAGPLEKKNGDKENNAIEVSISSTGAESPPKKPQNGTGPIDVQAARAPITAVIAKANGRHLRTTSGVFLALAVMVLAAVGPRLWDSRESAPPSSSLAVGHNELLDSQIVDLAQPLQSDWQPKEKYSGQHGAESEEFKAFKNDNLFEKFATDREHFSRPIFESDLQEGVESLRSGLAPGFEPPPLEESQSFLAALNDRPRPLKEEQQAALPSTTAAGTEGANLNRPNDSGQEPFLLAPGLPRRALIAACGSEGQAVIERLGELRMAAHEGADGHRWVRVIGPNWRRDLAAGDRLPIGSPGEARVWVDEEGVFGVVKLAGQTPCRVMWEK